MCEIRIYAFGFGADGWPRIIHRERADPLEWRIAPWPSEMNAPHYPVDLSDFEEATHTSGGFICICAGSVPHRAKGCEFLKSKLPKIGPSLVLLGSRPCLKFTCRTIPRAANNRRAWSWMANTSSIGEPQARERYILAITRIGNTYADYTSALYIFGVTLSAAIVEFLSSADRRPYSIGGIWNPARISHDVYQPAPLGRIRLSNNEMVYRVRVIADGEPEWFCKKTAISPSYLTRRAHFGFV